MTTTTQRQTIAASLNVIKSLRADERRTTADERTNQSFFAANHALNDVLFGSAFRWHRGDSLNLHSATALTQIVRGLHKARAGERARAAIAESLARVPAVPVVVEKKKGVRG